MVRDKKTGNQTAIGEKPKIAEYLVMMQVSVHPTTVESHGHTLGAMVHVMRSYCASCKAGCGMCYHRRSLLWMQYLHWDEGRPTPTPATASFCSWVPGSHSKRNCSTIEPASKSTIEKSPRSETKAQAKVKHGRQSNMKEGLTWERSHDRVEAKQKRRMKGMRHKQTPGTESNEDQQRVNIIEAYGRRKGERRSKMINYPTRQI